MNFKHSWTRRLKYVFPIMMMLGTLFGLKQPMSLLKSYCRSVKSNPERKE